MSLIEQLTARGFDVKEWSGMLTRALSNPYLQITDKGGITFYINNDATLDQCLTRYQKKLDLFRLAKKTIGENMNCNCIKEINNKLREKNLKLTGFAYVMPDLCCITTVNTEWIDKLKAPRGQKNNPAKIFSSYCPFCGKSVEKEAL